jgi:hypothetical protein
VERGARAGSGSLEAAGIAPEYGGSQFKIVGQQEALVCPEGQRLEWVGNRKHHGIVCRRYQAKEADCLGCEARNRCCGKRNRARSVERAIEPETVQSLAQRMSEPAARALYKRRKEVAEWPHLWIKSLRGFQRFPVRGIYKVGLEGLWVALAYNVEQLMRVRRTAIAIPT